MNCYIYDGPVMNFENCILNHWKASTYAVSEAKAISNLTFQYKQKHNLVLHTKISLPGKLMMIQ